MEHGRVGKATETARLNQSEGARAVLSGFVFFCFQDAISGLAAVFPSMFWAVDNNDAVTTGTTGMVIKVTHNCCEATRNAARPFYKITF